MEVILKSLNQEKTLFKFFPVKISKDHNYAIIFELTPELITFLPDLVIGIRDLMPNEVSIYATGDCINSEINDVYKLKINENNIELLKPQIKPTITSETN